MQASTRLTVRQYAPSRLMRAPAARPTDTAPARRPAPLPTYTLAGVAQDVREELRSRHRGFPPGPLSFDLMRTVRFTRDPLPLLRSLHARYGPIFGVRLLHQRQVMMIGPEANHFITVGHPELFHWREGHFGELTPLVGDGLITTDGPYHDRARRLMMPAFHRERIAATVATIVEEAERGQRDWEPGATVDLYAWSRLLALRIAMRALVGLDPDDGDRGAAAGVAFERALSFYGTHAHTRLLRGPFSPWRRLQDARRALDAIVLEEIARRRRAEESGAEPGRDVLGLLVAARGEDGDRLSDDELRDHVVTLLFAGHDTSTSTLAFLVHELARAPVALERVQAELDHELAGAPPTADRLGELNELSLAIDEALRLYPPVWIGARRAVRTFEFGGHRVPAGTYVNYSSYATHRMPEVFPEPDAFHPHRFLPERRAQLPRGAYLPFGAGGRICIGKRFGRAVVTAVAASLLARWSPEPVRDGPLAVDLEPTLSPRGGLPVVLRARSRVAPRAEPPAGVECGLRAAAQMTTAHRVVRGRERPAGRRERLRATTPIIGSLTSVSAVRAPMNSPRGSKGVHWRLVCAIRTLVADGPPRRLASRCGHLTVPSMGSSSFAPRAQAALHPSGRPRSAQPSRSVARTRTQSPRGSVAARRVAVAARVGLEPGPGVADHRLELRLAGLPAELGADLVARGDEDRRVARPARPPGGDVDPGDGRGRLDHLAHREAAAVAEVEDPVRRRLDAASAAGARRRGPRCGCSRGRRCRRASGSRSRRSDARPAPGGGPQHERDHVRLGLVVLAEVPAGARRR